VAEPPASLLDDANRIIEYHSPISYALTAERTSLESKLIPVSAYVITSCIEAYLRYPAMIERIEQAMSAEEIGRLARRPGCRVNTVHLWSIPNFWLIGRKVFQTVGWPGTEDPVPAHRVLSFAERVAMAFRGDGTRSAWDTSAAAVYPPEVVQELLAGSGPVSDEQRDSIKRFNATLVNYLFLLYFDTRVGAGDTGPYVLPDGRHLLVRDFYQLGPSDFWWSDVARDVPYRNLTAAMVLDPGAKVARITDFGTTYTEPEDYLDHVAEYGLFTTDDGGLRPVPLDELDGIVAAVRAAQKAHYRNIVAMDRHEKIRCGAYVYFAFLRPYARIAGVEDELDWTVPRDIPPPVYDLVSAMEGDNAPPADDGPYYAPLAPS
jgi:hypothetical protein